MPSARATMGVSPRGWAIGPGYIACPLGETGRHDALHRVSLQGDRRGWRRNGDRVSCFDTRSGGGRMALCELASRLGGSFFAPASWSAAVLCRLVCVGRWKSRRARKRWRTTHSKTLARGVGLVAARGLPPFQDECVRPRGWVMLFESGWSTSVASGRGPGWRADTCFRAFRGPSVCPPARA